MSHFLFLLLHEIHLVLHEVKFGSQIAMRYRLLATLYNTVAKREKPTNTQQHNKISSKCMPRSAAQNLWLLTTKTGQKLHLLQLFYFQNLLPMGVALFAYVT